MGACYYKYLIWQEEQFISVYSTGGQNINPTPTCHVNLDWYLMPEHTCKPSLMHASHTCSRYFTSISIGLNYRNICEALLATRKPSLLANLWPGNIAQVPTYSRIRLVHKGLVKGRKTVTLYFPSGIDTGRLFSLSQHIRYSAEAHLYYLSQPSVFYHIVINDVVNFIFFFDQWNQTFDVCSSSGSIMFDIIR